MKTRVFRIGTILVLCLAAAQAIALADDDTPGIEGLWIVNVTPVDCQTRATSGPTFRGLNMFIHGGSFTNDAAFPTPSPRRGVGLGAWRHIQGRTFTFTFWLFRYNPDGSFLEMRKVTSTIELSGDRFTAADVVQVFDANNALILTGCATEAGTRAQ
jgi:hypothetical protein